MWCSTISTKDLEKQLPVLALPEGLSCSANAALLACICPYHAPGIAVTALSGTATDAGVQPNRRDRRRARRSREPHGFHRLQRSEEPGRVRVHSLGHAAGVRELRWLGCRAMARRAWASSAAIRDRVSPKAAAACAGIRRIDSAVVCRAGPEWNRRSRQGRKAESRPFDRAAFRIFPYCCWSPAIKKG